MTDTPAAQSMTHNRSTLKALAEQIPRKDWRIATDPLDADAWFHPVASECVVVAGDYAMADMVCATNDDGICTEPEILIAQFIAAANPAVVLALLADLARVEAERDAVTRRAEAAERDWQAAEAALATLRETHARLIPRAQVVQQQHAWLWDAGPEEIAHRQTCTDPAHAGCALVQVVESAIKAER